MTDGARAIAGKIFDIIAAAEAKAHGTSLEEVHFHEVGAMDSIVDVVAAAVCLDNLGVTEVIIPELCEGRGTVRCQHGILPVPVPAVANIAQANALPLRILPDEGELITPTGAAIAAAVRTGGKLPERFTVVRTGLGAGKRAYEVPSILRAMLLQPAEEDGEEIWELNANLDDCTGEALGRVTELLLEAGALDAYCVPIYMKKNRPAWMLGVLCRRADIPALEGIIFRETTTIGIRRHRTERTVLPREMRMVQTKYGTAQVKVCTLPDGTERAYPEYESVNALCRESGAAYQEAVREILAQCRG